MWKIVNIWVFSATFVLRGGHEASVFYSGREANQVLKIQKRENTFLEELKGGSLERECYEERCDFEEANEIFKTKEATMGFWTKYVDGDQCENVTCFNGTCVDGFERFQCVCNAGWEGQLCQHVTNYTNCSVDYGGCEHFCHEDQEKGRRYCSCASGYQLKDDHISCQPVGKYHRWRSDDGEQAILTDKLVPHENYNKTSSDNDIALLHLARPVFFNKYVLPICLPVKNLAKQELTKEGTQTVVTGWGTQSENSATNYTSVLNYIEVPVAPRNECAHAMQNLISDNMLCAGILGDKRDSCHGDSGGPMVTQFKKTWFLVGLVSWGEGCGNPDNFGIYTKISSYLEWIDQQLKTPQKPKFKKGA
ncbi:vitamin K-dependent protein C-like isoform X2 [Paroedura picta]|uniref:vitamin K-dependent protein C-like isoform X2 n=1 Tax=Paroedura picta TaxID=143630 RepID=UPI0040561C87